MTLNNFFRTLEKAPNIVKLFGLSIVALLTAYVVYDLKPYNDVVKSSVMILSTTKQNGGSGVVLTSSNTGSTILTNSHVCGVVEKGGIIVHNNNTHKIFSFKKSKTHDLCLITVKANLGVSTSVASKSPNSYYEKAFISGHPSLLPNVVTSGHFSGKMIIQVMTGVVKCTDADFEKTPFICLLLGGKPIIVEYESTLVTATIMPGSSGSGVYNEKMQLAGLAFAGGREFSYAWTVPFEDMKFFIDQEVHTLKDTVPSSVVSNTDDKEKDGNPELEETFNRLRFSCRNYDQSKLLGNVCDVVQRDILWRK